MDSYNNLLNRVNGGHNFAAVSNIRVTKVEDDYAEGVLDITRESLNPLGFVHGGLLCTLADTVTGTAAYTRGKICVTLNCSMNYFIQGSGKQIHCAATAKRVGKTISVYEATLTNDDDDVVATGTFTFFTKDKPVPEYKG